MRLVRRIGSMLLGGSTLGALALGALTLTASPARAFPPVLLCGPTLLWYCTGPSGPKYLFSGTVCEMRIFERRTGTSCVPYTG